MNMNISFLCALFLCVFGSCEKNPPAYERPAKGVNAPELEPVKVQVVKVGERWRLYRNGELYYVRGAATNKFYDQVDDFGGNTIRTYGINDTTEKILDLAQANGLSVNMGLWVKRQTDGFNYDDEAAVQQQLEEMRTQVRRFKDHPAILVWSIGNEPDASYTNLKLWNAINDIAAMIHEEDPDHPTTVALANSDPNKIKAIMERAPEIDILSINAYAPQISGVITNLKSAGWDKPYFITEFGPRGTWQMAPEPSRIMPWGGLVEQSSTEKAQVYQQAYKEHIFSNVNNGCLGSFVFLWGHQTHGAVLNWYGLFDRSGRAYAAADAMQYCWTGQYPSNRAPVISSRNDMLMNGKRAEDIVSVRPSSANQATVAAYDMEGDPLQYEWVIIEEGSAAADGGFPPGIPGLIAEPNSRNITFTAPAAPGAYRLYVFVYDDHNKVASAAIPFLVE